MADIFKGYTHVAVHLPAPFLGSHHGDVKAPVRFSIGVHLRDWDDGELMELMEAPTICWDIFLGYEWLRLVNDDNAYIYIYRVSDD